MRSAPPTEIRLSDSARATLGRTSADVHRSLTHGAKFLVALNAKAARNSSPIFAGVGLTERARRRAAGRIAKASRKTNRGR